MDDKCICGHDFDDHSRGPIEIKHVRYWHAIKEIRLECCICDCHKYRKNSWWCKFWNGTE
jgi:hypothetical protein